VRAKNDVYVSAVKNFFGADFMSYRLFFFQEIEQFQSNRRFSEIDIYFGKLIEKVIGGAKNLMESELYIKCLKKIRKYKPNRNGK